ncbi:hypothetical protein PR048_028852 [Dryococelus australis]|uniref:Uncharacterized protein n=1 Tax=Dryococelus australis TaxID=614101 RepID=A0ABQ9GBQ6_9NEOP|nr:hypothetical protein PR048_028852 [Dryococelus australis]
MRLVYWLSFRAMAVTSPVLMLPIGRCNAGCIGFHDEQLDVGHLWSIGSGNSPKSLDKCVLKHLQRAAVGPTLIYLLQLMYWTPVVHHVGNYSIRNVVMKVLRMMRPAGLVKVALRCKSRHGGRVDDGPAHVLKPHIGILPAFLTHSCVLHSSLATKFCKADIRMNRFTFNEVADMHLCYGAANASAHAARILYAQRFPRRVIYQVTCIFRQWTSHCVKQVRRKPIRRDIVAEHPGTSTRVVAGQLGISHTTYGKCRKNTATMPITRQKCTSSIHGITDHALSSENGTTHNADVDVLPELLEDVPLETRANMWLQHHNAPAHSAIRVRNFLHQIYPNRWVGRYSPFPWPASMKELIYSTSVVSKMDLAAPTAAAAPVIQTQEGVLSRMREAMTKRCNACIRAKGQTLNMFCETLHSVVPKELLNHVEFVTDSVVDNARSEYEQKGLKQHRRDWKYETARGGREI